MSCPTSWRTWQILRSWKKHALTTFKMRVVIVSSLSNMPRSRTDWTQWMIVVSMSSHSHSVYEHSAWAKPNKFCFGSTRIQLKSTWWTPRADVADTWLKWITCQWNITDRYTNISLLVISIEMITDLLFTRNRHDIVRIWDEQTWAEHGVTESYGTLWYRIRHFTVNTESPSPVTQVQWQPCHGIPLDKKA